jgi:hypothetical protein
MDAHLIDGSVLEVSTASHLAVSQIFGRCSVKGSAAYTDVPFQTAVAQASTPIRPLAHHRKG